VHPGEVAVEDNHVVGVEIELHRCLEPVVCDIDRHRFVVQSFHERVRERAGVFDHEDFHAAAPAAVLTVSGRVIATHSPPSLSASRSSAPP